MTRSFRSFAVIGLSFAILFTLVAAGQYAFLRQQLYEETERNLRKLAEEMREDVAFDERWNLEGYRRTSSGPDIYLVVAENGTVIDTHGYLPTMLSRVEIPFPLNSDHVVQYASDIGEKWYLYSHPLRDGLLILGVRAEIVPEHLNETFAKNAARFGTIAAEAIRVPERAVHESLDYVIIDSAGTARRAMGGIPLKTARPRIPLRAYSPPVQRIDDSLYASLKDPITSSSGRRVGSIQVFEDVTDEHRVLHRSALFNMLVGGVMWFATIGLGGIYLRRITPEAVTCSRILSLHEGETVEFKASLRWDYENQKQNRDLEKAVVKTIAGFLNSEAGGTLIIGISDKKEVLGLEPDYLLQKTRRDRDGFEQTLSQVLINAVGESCFARYVKIKFCLVEGKEICTVRVAPARRPVFLPEEKGVKIMYVRTANSTRPLTTPEAVAYASERWGGPAFHWPFVKGRAQLFDA